MRCDSASSQTKGKFFELILMIFLGRCAVTMRTMRSYLENIFLQKSHLFLSCFGVISDRGMGRHGGHVFGIEEGVGGIVQYYRTMVQKKIHTMVTKKT